MTQARSRQISLQDTCYYHLISSCVRRAFLCGVDKYDHKSYEHRWQWMVGRIRFLCSVFAIDIAAYAEVGKRANQLLHNTFENITVVRTQLFVKWRGRSDLYEIALNIFGVGNV